ncbi:MAG TPA: hypothetical protein VF006_01620 [Longimicrobium sp.]
MKIYSAEVWYTYASFMGKHVEDLHTIAQRLLAERLSTCVMHQDGTTYWNSHNGVHSGVTTVDPHNQTGDNLHLKLHDGENPPAGWALDAWSILAAMRWNELRLFGADRPMPAPYIRTFLGECSFGSLTTPTFIGRPIITLYETGVILFQLRGNEMPEQPDAETFVNRYVNLASKRFSEIWVHPAYARLATRAWHHLEHPGQNFRQRLTTSRLDREHDIAVRQSSLVDHTSDEPTPKVLLPSSADEQLDTLQTFADLVFHIIAFIVGPPRSGWRYVLRGQSQIPEVGRFWTGRPHIYLYRFDDQCDTPAENEEKHRRLFGGIIARALHESADMSKLLPKNLRLLPDYGLYIAQSAILVAYSNSGFPDAASNEPTPSEGDILGHVVTFQMLEYGYMLHRSLAESAGELNDVRAVYETQQELARLKVTMSEVSHYGEIIGVLEEGWESFRVNALMNWTSESLAATSALTSLRDTRITERASQVLSVLFGMIAVPPIASDVILPLWKLFGWPMPKDPDSASLMMVGIAFVLVAVVLIGMLRFVARAEE